MPERLHLEIPVWSAQGWLGPELVEAHAVGGGRYVIDCPPRFAYGLAVGDEIELVPSIPEGFRVVRRSGLLTVCVYCPTDEVAQRLAARANTLLQRVGAKLEGVPPQMLIITAPLAAGWQALEAVMTELTDDVADVSWEYANVYAVEDGVTPLNWWQPQQAE